MKKFRIVNCAEVVGSKNWTFLQDELSDVDAEWTFHRCEPANWLERTVRKPQISRFRACLRAALDARFANSVIVSHLPRATWWTEHFNQTLGGRKPHIAFSFNFTDVPTDRQKVMMMRSFRTIDRFVVYSTVEKHLYSEYFDIDPARIDVLLWAMDTPKIGPHSPLVEGEYVCAVGGEGRDYPTLFAAIRQLPEIQLVVVARPSNLSGLKIPPNVKVFTNLPSQSFWNVVKFSKFSVIPLRNEQTNCGHISLVGSMLFGKPLIATNSRGIDDYVEVGKNGLVMKAGDSEALADAIQRLWNDSGLFRRMAELSLQFSHDRHRPHNWVDYLRRYLADKMP